MERSQLVVNFFAPVVGLVALIAVWAAPAVGQTQEKAAPKIQRILVPADKPEIWPAGDWHAVSQADFAAFLRAERPAGQRPVTTWIARAAYSARFVGNTLQDGLMTALVEFSGTKPELLSLEPLNLAVSELHWADADATDGSRAEPEQPQENAIWGTTPQGETALLVDRPSGQLQGRWTLGGRRLPRSVEFDLQVAPATVSQIEIRLPAGRVLRSSVGHVAGPLPTDEPGWMRWLVELGTRTSCRLTVGQRSDEPAREPVVLVRHDFKYVVRPGGLLIDRADFHVEAFETPVQDLTFVLPAQVAVYGITYGTDTPLPWQRKESGDRQEISVRLPDPLLGPGRPIRIRGTAPLKLHQSWTLPSIALENARFLSGRIALSVLSPFELRTFESPGCRQQEPETSDGRSLTFHQYLADGRVSLEVGYPVLSLAADVLTHAVADGESWSLKWEVQWRAKSGAGFVVRCRIPRGWEITAVQPRPQATGAENVSWNVRRIGNQRVLVLEFLDALTPEQPKTVLISARQLPRQAERGAGLPILEPMSCDDVETLLAVSHPSTAVPALRPDGQFEAAEESDLPDAWRELPLWNEIRSAGSTRFFTPVSRPIPRGGQLLLQRSQRLVKGTARVAVGLESERVREEFLIEGEPGADPVDRTLIYLSTAGPDLSWELLPERLGLEARRLDPAQHADWNLPEAGELWEILFPAPRRERFQLSARRHLEAAAQFTPALAVVPQSQTFEGFVELESDELQVRILRNELETVAPADVPAGLKTSDPRPGASPHVWRYDSLAGGVEMQLQTTGAARRLIRTASLELRTRLAAGDAGYDLHEALIVAADDRGDGEFLFRLPDGAELVSARIDGRKAEAASRDGGFVLAAPPSDPAERIEIRYRTPARSGFLRHERAVGPPRISWEVIDFAWELALPPKLRLGGEPAGVRLLEPLPRGSHLERFFGPLGRSAYEPVFNPLSWNSWTLLFAPSPDGAVDSSETADSRNQRQAADFEYPVPRGWAVRRAAAPRAPESIGLELWDRWRLQSLGWLAVALCLTTGLLFRMIRWSGRVAFGALWLSLCLAAAWWSPPIYAELIGGCLSGSLIAGLLPRRMLRPLGFEGASPDNMSLGSTATFHHASQFASHRASTFLLLAGLTLWGTAAAVGQDERRIAPRDLREAGGNGAAPAEQNAWDVLIPVDADEQPDPEFPVVWVGPELAARIQTVKSQRPASVDYLLMSADYRGEVDEQQNVVLHARLRAAVLSQRDSVRVQLPIVNAHLGGPHACRVNGVAHTVLQGAGGRGFSIELKRRVAAEGVGRTRLEALAPLHAWWQGLSEDRPAPVSSRPLQTGVEVFDIELELYPPIQALPAGGRLRVGVPAVLASRLTLNFPAAVSAVEFPDARGAVGSTAGARASSAPLGKVEQLHAAWSQEARPVTTPVALQADVVRHVQIHPTWLQFRYQVAYRVLDGPVDFVSWQVPREVAVRDGDVWADGLPARARVSRRQEPARLIIEFPQPLSDDFLVEAAFIVPIDPDAQTVALPKIDLADGEADPPQTVEILEDSLGVSTPAGFRLTPLMQDAADVDSLSADAFLRRWSDEGGSRKPQVDSAYRLKNSTAPMFEFAALPPVRKVRMYQEARIGKQRLDWTLRGEIETTQAPAFQHALALDPRLNVDSISVQEDGAERRARWSRTQDGVLVFLKDKTIGTQTIVVTAGMPLQLGRETPLPAVHLQDAELVDSRLLLFHDAGVLVQLDESDGLVPLDTAAEGGADGEKGVLLGQYRLSSGRKLPPIRTSARDGQAVVDSVTVLERQDDHHWRLAATLRFRILNEQPGNLYLTIPPELAGDSQLHLTDATHTETSLPDGSRKITLRPVASTSGDFSATVIGTFDTSRGETWPLPHLDVLNATGGANYLILAPGKSLQPLSPSGERLQADALPRWIRDTPAFDLDDDDFEAYLGPGSRWKLNLARPARTPETARVPLVETQLRLDLGPTGYGRTTIHAAAAGAGRLEISWPAESALRAVFIDGRPAAFEQLAPDRLQIPLGARNGLQSVVLLWTRPAQEWTGWRWRDVQTSLPLPAPAGIPVERSLFAAAAPPHLHLKPHHDASSLEEVSYLLDRLEGLIEVCRYRRNHDLPLQPADWNVLVHIEQRLGRHFSLPADNGESNGPPVEQSASNGEETTEAQRFAEALQQIARLRESLGDDVPAETAPGPWAAMIGRDLSIAVHEPAAGMVYGSLPAGTAAAPVFWRIDRRSIAALLTVLGLIVSVWILKRVLKLRAGEWINEHRPLSLVALGVIWWAWLTPSFLGILLLAATGLQLLRRWLRKPDAEAVVVEY